MTKRLILLTVGAIASSALVATAFAAGKPAILFPGGGYTSLLAAVAGVKGDEPRKLAESQRECIKGHLREARKKLDEFIKLIASPRTGLSDATVAGLINQALAIRDGLV